MRYVWDMSVLQTVVMKVAALIAPILSGGPISAVNDLTLIPKKAENTAKIALSRKTQPRCSAWKVQSSLHWADLDTRYSFPLLADLSLLYMRRLSTTCHLYQTDSAEIFSFSFIFSILTEKYVISRSNCGPLYVLRIYHAWVLPIFFN